MFQSDSKWFCDICGREVKCHEFSTWEKDRLFKDGNGDRYHICKSCESFMREFAKTMKGAKPRGFWRRLFS